MEPYLTCATRVDFTTENCANCVRLVPASKEQKIEPRTSVGFRGASPRDSHLIFDDEVIKGRTVKRMPEERRSATGCSAVTLTLRVSMSDWPSQDDVTSPGTTSGIEVELQECKACGVDSTHDNKQCIERFQTIFGRKDAAAAVARAGAEVSTTQGHQAGSSSGAAPPVVLCSS